MVKFITQERANSKALTKRIESTLKQQKSAEEKAFVSNNGRVSPGAKRLANDMEVPEFESQEAALAWYNAQPEITKSAVRLKLGGK
jgi:hypothetical protein